MLKIGEPNHTYVYYLQMFGFMMLLGQALASPCEIKVTSVLFA